MHDPVDHIAKRQRHGRRQNRLAVYPVQCIHLLTRMNRHSSVIASAPQNEAERDFSDAFLLTRNEMNVAIRLDP